MGAHLNTAARIQRQGRTNERKPLSLALSPLLASWGEGIHGGSRRMRPPDGHSYFRFAKSCALVFSLRYCILEFLNEHHSAIAQTSLPADHCPSVLFTRSQRFERRDSPARFPSSAARRARVGRRQSGDQT